jgi:hypothetical protein
MPEGPKDQVSLTVYASKGTRSETANPSSEEAMTDPVSGETTTYPASGIHGTAGIRVALHHRPRPNRALGREREDKNPPRRVRDRSPSRLTQARNQPRRRQEGVRRSPPPHRKPPGNLICTVSIV